MPNEKIFLPTKLHVKNSLKTYWIHWRTLSVNFLIKTLPIFLLSLYLLKKAYLLKKMSRVIPGYTRLLILWDRALRRKLLIILLMLDKRVGHVLKMPKEPTIAGVKSTELDPSLLQNGLRYFEINQLLG